MSKFRLNDWNDARLLLACAEYGSFAGAAAALGLDQSTVSRRIATLEAVAGRPLFTRRRSGAAPTAAGQALIERARALADTVRGFEGEMDGLAALSPPTVTIAATEGLLTYLIIPAFLGTDIAGFPLDRRSLKMSLPAFRFAPVGNPADITVLPTDPGVLPQVRGAMRVRKVGSMPFFPAAAADLLRRTAAIDHFDQLGCQPVIDIGIYRLFKSMDRWQELVAGLDEGPVLTVANTPDAHRPFVGGGGYTILPSFAGRYDPRIIVFDSIPCPRLAVDLWLIAHEDNLREPAVRQIYDVLARMFLGSHWFR